MISMADLAALMPCLVVVCSESFVSFLSSLGGYLLSLLRDHRSSERDDDPNLIDELLVGCLRFLTLLIRNSLLSDRESFILFVYSSCLFATANERMDGCLCKSTVSRSVAFCALLYASQQSTRCFALLTQLISSDKMWQVDRTACGWRYEPYLLDKDEQGAPVGLRNLGSTWSVKHSRHRALAAITTLLSRLPGRR